MSSGGYDTLNFGFIPESDNEIASYLRNTSGLVKISNSLPPTPGQIMTATSATEASWSNMAEVQSWANVLALGNTSGANNVIVQQKLQMPIAQPTNTTNLLNVTTGNGPPTSVLADGVIRGSLYFDTGLSQLWMFNGITWVSDFAPASWAAVLSTGQLSGGTNPTISTGDFLQFQTEGNIRCSSAADNINVLLGAGKHLYVDKTVVSQYVNGGAGKSSSSQIVNTGGVAVLLDLGVVDYEYDDDGNTVVDIADNLISLIKLDSAYQVNAHVVVQSDAVPNACTTSHNIRVNLRYDDGVSPVYTLEEAYAWFQPNGDPNLTRTSLSLSLVVASNSNANQNVSLTIERPPNGGYSVIRTTLSAMLLN